MKLESCRIARYRFTLAFEQPARLPLFTGSMLRGAFGHALRRLACVTRQRECAGCTLLAGCHYPALFEPRLKADKTGGAPDPSPPYILEPALGGRELAAGEPWQFDLVLMGPALEALSMVILAFSQAARAGLGKGKQVATLERVEVQQGQGWQLVCDQRDPLIRAHDSGVAPLPAMKAGAIRLELLTPTRLLRQGHPVGPEKIRAPDFLGALLRRGSQLGDYLGLPAPASVDLQPAGLEPVSLRWLEWERYSNRQQQSMSLGGLVGQFELTHLPEALWPWLWLGQWGHVGKNASFGLGHYRLLGY